MTDLKPCPFCGSDSVRLYSCLTTNRFYASCRTCFAETQEGTTEQATHAWNTRACTECEGQRARVAALEAVAVAAIAYIQATADPMQSVWRYEPMEKRAKLGKAIKAAGFALPIPAPALDATPPEQGQSRAEKLELVAVTARELRAFGDPGLMPADDHRRWREIQAKLDALLAEVAK